MLAEIDVAIIGAGVIGLATAREIAQEKKKFSSLKRTALLGSRPVAGIVK